MAPFLCPKCQHDLLSPEDPSSPVECCSACGHCAPLPDSPGRELPEGLPDVVYTLGDPTAVYAGNRYGPLRRILETTTLRALGCLAVVWIAQQFAAAIAANDFRFTGWQIAGFVAIAFPVWATVHVVLDNWQSACLHTAVVFSDSLVGITKEGRMVFLTLCWGQLQERPREVLVFPWDEIEGVTQEALLYQDLDGPKIQHLLTVRRQDGKRLVVKAGFSFPEPNLVRLIETVQGEMTARLLPLAIERYYQGETIHFRGTSVSREGFGTGNRMSAWAEIEDVTVEEGTINVRHKDGSKEVAEVGRVENLFVLLGLLREAVGLPVQIQSLVPRPPASSLLPVGQATPQKMMRMVLLLAALTVVYSVIFYLGPLLSR
jgi:hypothetical protein